MDSTKILSFCLFVFMVIAQIYAKKYVKKSFTIANYNEGNENLVTRNGGVLD